MHKRVEQSIWHDLEASGAGAWISTLRHTVEERFERQRRDRKCQIYSELLAMVPSVQTQHLRLDHDWVEIGGATEVDEAEKETLELALFGLRPWRKGPFKIFGIDLDTEWVSYLKWKRLEQHLAPLRGRKVLDIGSSSGYYLFRMKQYDPALLLGLEPYATFYYQFCFLAALAKLERVHTLPLKFEELPPMPGFFDTVFHMGVLYHVRSPLHTLTALRRTLRRGGELVLETLVIPGEEDVALTPRGRYAKMNNVFFLPTVTCLECWLERTGFTNIRCIDVSRTTEAEQRKTAWIQTESLADFLHPDDLMRTIEGYPAPRRALVLAQVK
ncbi:MAG: tRNA 5-methoxyuridine(34)/uridine 5-oxyacetic acid(34) synthase CmoB [Desulfuromonadaceae bacterium]|nr:tRNA 5-methoxyuridine(34)/uridine 5-oxyacetic acid(34) synthase CmoB [Desulfuromonadaceae bacterium]